MKVALTYRRLLFHDIKTRLGYDLHLCFPHELIISLRYYIKVSYDNKRGLTLKACTFFSVLL